MTKTGRHPQWSLPPFDLTRKCSGLKPDKAPANQDKLVTQIYQFRAKQAHTGGERSNPTPICSKQCENQTWKQPGSYLNLTSSDLFLDNEQESHFLWIECAYWGDTSVGTAWRCSTAKPTAVGYPSTPYTKSASGFYLACEPRPACTWPLRFTGCFCTSLSCERLQWDRDCQPRWEGWEARRAWRRDNPNIIASYPW